MIPKPKAEIVVEISLAVNLVTVHCSSLDAHKWVSENGERFCELFRYDSHRKCFSMFVSPLYYIEEVAAYILSQGKDANA